MNALFLWILIEGYGSIAGNGGVKTFVIAGVVFSLVNAFLKPIIKIFALPITLLTMGVFTLVVNGFVLWIAIAISPNLSMSFGDSIIAGIAMSTVNYWFGRFFNNKEEL